MFHPQHPRALGGRRADKREESQHDYGETSASELHHRPSFLGQRQPAASHIIAPHRPFHATCARDTRAYACLSHDVDAFA